MSEMGRKRTPASTGAVISSCQNRGQEDPAPALAERGPPKGFQRVARGRRGKDERKLLVVASATERSSRCIGPTELEL